MVPGVPLQSQGHLLLPKHHLVQTFNHQCHRWKCSNDFCLGCSLHRVNIFYLHSPSPNSGLLIWDCSAWPRSRGWSSAPRTPCTWLCPHPVPPWNWVLHYLSQIENTSQKRYALKIWSWLKCLAWKQHIFSETGGHKLRYMPCPFRSKAKTCLKWASDWTRRSRTIIFCWQGYFYELNHHDKNSLLAFSQYIVYLLALLRWEHLNLTLSRPTPLTRYTAGQQQPWR